MSDFIKVANSPVFNLKDKQNKNYMKINLVDVFGFPPKVIIIEKIPRMNNTLIVRGIIPDDMDESEVQNGKKSSN